jgi:predicted metal-binding membrane protein
MVSVESRRVTVPPIVLVATLGLAAACWPAAAWLMRGMDMGIETGPGPFWSFTTTWLTMMAAMMLPGAAPAVTRHVRVTVRLRGAPRFAGAYLAVWALVGIVAYALDRPHGTLAAGLVVIAAGAYELTPVKRRFRQCCREEAGSGLRYGLYCAGSSIGLMAVLVALDVMSLFWMSVVAALAWAQKLLPAKAAIDVPSALSITGLGLLVVFAPSLVPGLMAQAM